MRNLLILAALLLATVPIVAQKDAQKKKDPVPVSSAVLQSETKLVVVDVVATDKKGNYVPNLEAKDFRLWEDNKEQTIKTFSSGTETPPTRYLILFFDGLNLSIGDQARARQFATQFVQAVAGPTRRMAVVDFNNTLRVAQDFTGDVERLTNAVKSVRMSQSAPAATVMSQNAPRGGRANNSTLAMPSTPGGFGSRVLVLSLKDLAKNLNAVPGRKTMIWFSGGFQSDNSELQSMLDVFNRSNVGIFPVDLASLTGMSPFASNRPPPSPRLGSMAFGFQQSGGTTGAGTTGGTTGGGATSGGGASQAPPSPAPGNATNPAPSNNPRGNTGMPNPAESITSRPDPRNMPQLGRQPFDDSVSNRQILATLADKTGGFVVHESSNVMEGLGRIGREQEAFYVLGYTPPSSEEGTCHSIKVKLNRGGINLRSRSGYCNARPADLLAGNPIEKQLETRAASSQPGNLAAAIQLPFFYSAENVARVNAAMEIALANLKFEKLKGKPHAAIHVLGTAFTPDGGVGARFSDTVNLDFDDQASADRFKEKPYHYENQFEVASGQYTLKLVFSSGRDNFGKLETPLLVEPYQPTQFAVSSLALSTQFRPAASVDLDGGVSLLGDNIPLVANGLQVIPSGANQFVKAQNAGFYCEIYEPLLVAPDPNTKLAVGIQVRVFDRKTGAQKSDSGVIRIDIPAKSETPVIRLGLKAPIADLDPGSYRLELTAMDSSSKLAKRSADFELK